MESMEKNCLVNSLVLSVFKEINIKHLNFEKTHAYFSAMEADFLQCNKKNKIK
jgi:hypothetical protein